LSLAVVARVTMPWNETGSGVSVRTPMTGGVLNGAIVPSAEAAGPARPWSSVATAYQV
jgi:hypothetical protein